MGRTALGEFEHQVLLAILQLGGQAYSAPVVTEMSARAGKAVSPAAVYIALRRLGPGTFGRLGAWFTRKTRRGATRAASAPPEEGT